MPGLILFNRRWLTSSDDFVFTSLGEILLRLSWLIAIIIIFCVHRNDFDCEDGELLRHFYIGTMVLLSLGIINLLFLMLISMRGSIKDPYPRRHIGVALYFKLFFFLPEFSWICLSTYWAFSNSFTCCYSVVVTVKAAIIFAWWIGFATFFGLVMAFDPIGSAKSRSAASSTSVDRESNETLNVGERNTTKVWESRMKCMLCCLVCRDDSHQAFTDVSKMIAYFFHDLDMMASDIVAGLVLVQKEQADRDFQITPAASNTGTSSIPTLNPRMRATLPMPKDWMTIPNMSHFMRYAMGSYGWPLYIFSNLCSGLCKLSTKFRCCSCVRMPHNVLKDNCFQCNMAAIKKFSGIKDEDIVYATFHNKYKESPFYVVLDRPKNCVVISIRGTMSLQDALADLWALGAPIEIQGMEDCVCHAAMLDCAKYIKSEIYNLSLLDKAFSCLPTGAGLVVTGHSLGAGVAAILSVLLKPDYPHLMCFSFSPPGGLMSPNVSDYAKDFVCSVVVNKDIVPRLGMAPLSALKVKILKALNNCDDPKCRILSTGCLRLLCGTRKTIEDLSKQTLMKDRLPLHYTEERPSAVVENSLQDSLRQAEMQLAEVLRNNWPLHPAGQILHITEVGDTPVCLGAEEAQYTAHWTDPHTFDKIIIHPKMMSDHLPNMVCFALEQLEHRQFVPEAPQQQEHHPQGYIA